MLKLYFAPGACSFVPHAALETIKAATGEDFEPLLVKLHKGEQSSPEYLALNPNGQVPVLIVEGKPLTQIVAIADYLDRRYPEAGLLPAEPWQRTEAMSCFAWMNNSVHPTFTHVFLPQKFSDSEAAQAEIKRYNIGLFRAHLERIQGLLARAAPFMFGAKPSFLDFYTLVFLRWGGMAGIDPDSLPAYKAFVERLAVLPPVAAALARERVPLHAYKKA